MNRYTFTYYPDIRVKVVDRYSEFYEMYGTVLANATTKRRKSCWYLMYLVKLDNGITETFYSFQLYNLYGEELDHDKNARSISKEPTTPAST